MLATRERNSTVLSESEIDLIEKTTRRASSQTYYYGRYVHYLIYTVHTVNGVAATLICVDTRHLTPTHTRSPWLTTFLSLDQCFRPTVSLLMCVKVHGRELCS